MPVNRAHGVPRTVSMTVARRAFGSLVRRAHSGERTTITDHGQPAAVLVNPNELADLEEALAVAEYGHGRPARRVPQAEVRVRLGLPRE